MSTDAEKSAHYQPWPWYAVLAFVAGCIWANLAQAVRGVVSIGRRGR